MIAYAFGIPMTEVENRSIVEYDLMLFTVINMATLHLGGDFLRMTPKEENQRLARQVKYFQSKGRLK
jgi:hypothetical protein